MTSTATTTIATPSTATSASGTVTDGHHIVETINEVRFGDEDDDEDVESGEDPEIARAFANRSKIIGGASASHLMDELISDLLVDPTAREPKVKKTKTMMLLEKARKATMPRSLAGGNTSANKRSAADEDYHKFVLRRETRRELERDPEERRAATGDGGNLISRVMVDGGGGHNHGGGPGQSGLATAADDDPCPINGCPLNPIAEARAVCDI